MVITAGFVIFSLSILLIVVIFLIFGLKLFQSSDNYALFEEYDDELFFLNPINNKKEKFQTVHENAECTLSIIVPAFNEEERLIPMLDEALCYLEERFKTEKLFTYEIIIVDDGSLDATSNVGLRYSQKYGYEKIKILKLLKNRGKGGAVAMGMFRSRGKLLLFADADGATHFPDIKKLEKSLLKLCEGSSDVAESLGIVCGSRAHLESESVARRSLFRTFLMHGFHALVWSFAVRNIRDTQCGFKLFTRRSARILFPNLHVRRWAFDVEMLYIAEKLKMPCDEVAVTWTEIDGSKVTPVISWIEMGLDIVIIWLKYTFGVWKLRLEPQLSSVDCYRKILSH